MTVSSPAVHPFRLFLPTLARHGLRPRPLSRPSNPISLSSMRFPPSRGSTQTARSWSPSLVSTVLLGVMSFSGRLRQPTCPSTLLPYPRPYPQYNTRIPYIVRSTSVFPEDQRIRRIRKTEEPASARRPERPTSSPSPSFTLARTASWPFFPSTYELPREHPRSVSTVNGFVHDRLAPKLSARKPSSGPPLLHTSTPRVYIPCVTAVSSLSLDISHRGTSMSARRLGGHLTGRGLRCGVRCGCARP
jgi:hypothetical protein